MFYYILVFEMLFFNYKFKILIENFLVINCKRTFFQKIFFQIFLTFFSKNFFQFFIFQKYENLVFTPLKL